MTCYTISHFAVGPFETNCYIITTQNKAIIFDPGSDANVIIQFLENNNLKPDIILLTHAHIDHISAVKEISDKYSLEVYLNADDESLYNSPLNSLEPFFPKLKEKAKTTSIFKLAPVIESIHTPGHTQGGTCFYIPKANILISGDTILMNQ